MMTSLKDTINRAVKPGNGRYRWLIWVGLLGILLVGLSEWIPSSGESLPNSPAAVSASELEQALEKRVTDLLRQMQGVGECRVMVTLEQGVQQVYATDTAGDSTQTLTVTTDHGPVGLPIAQVQPVVKGVAVVCAGGGNPAVNEQVSDLITTVFHISTHRVCVTQMN